MDIPVWVAILLVILSLAYYFGTKSHGFFIKHKLPFVQPLPFVGNMGPIVARKAAISDQIDYIYKQFEGFKMNGFFNMNKPAVMLRDPEMIKQIMVKDFDHFTDHGMPVHEDDLFGKNLFTLKGDRWRDMRHTLSPAFTSSKMKNMFGLIEKCGQQMGEHLEKRCKAAPDGVLQLEMKDFYTKYTNDVIATSAFGLHVDSLEVPDNEFYVMGKSATNINPLKFFIIALAPNFFAYCSADFVSSSKDIHLFDVLMQKFGIHLFSRKITDFFRSLVHGTIAEREKKGIVRPDMIHLLMQARKEAKNTVLTDDDITAQAFIFFFAGFDTASTLLSFASHLLALNPDVQERVQEEVDRVLEEHNGEVTYEGVQQMKYMDNVISETLRMWPPAVASDRVCVRPYVIPATETSPEVKLNVGDLVWIPTYALQRDPKFFPDPEQFDPERFNEENKGKVDPFTFLPFGVGPRVCIGQRFAQMEVKIALMALLSRFTLKITDKTAKIIKINKTIINLTAEGGTWLGIELRSNKK